MTIPPVRLAESPRPDPMTDVPDPRAALLATGQPTEAEHVFREDLKINPGNGRSLFGVWKALQAQGKAAEAAAARRDFERVWRVADVTLRLEDM